MNLRFCCSGQRRDWCWGWVELFGWVGVLRSWGARQFYAAWLGASFIDEIIIYCSGNTAQKTTNKQRKATS